MDDRKIDEYRQPWESEDHWKLRKEFIHKYKDQFPEYTLIALSQVHADTGLHGKRFPVPVILPSSQECVKTADEKQEQNLSGEEKMQGNYDVSAESDQGGAEEQVDAEFLHEGGEEELDDREAFVEVLEEDYDENQMSDEKNSGSNSRTQITQRNVGPGSSLGEKEALFDELSESSNDESGMSSAQADGQQSQFLPENSAGELPESLKENLVDVFQFVRKLNAEKLNASQILDRLSKKFNVKVECPSEELRKAKCTHVCSVVVDDVLISMGKAPTKKGARRQAVNLAVARLMNINWLLVKANFSFSKLSEIVCATKQSSLLGLTQEVGGVSLGSASVQGVEFNATPEKLQGETGWNSSQDIMQTSSNLFESSSGQNELLYDFQGNLEGETGQNYTMQSSYARSEESSSSEKVIQGMLPKSLKDSFIDVFDFIKKMQDEKLNSLQILEKVAKQFDAKVEFHTAVFTHAKSVHHCTVEIDGVLISRGKGLTKKNARRDGGKLAVDRLMQLLTRAKLSFNYRNKLSTSTSMNSFDMLGNSNITDPMSRDINTNNVMYENYPCQNKFDDVSKTMLSSSDSTMMSSKSLHSVNSYGLNTLPAHLKARFKQVSQFVRKSVTQKLNPVSVVNNMAQKFKLTVKFKVKEHHFLLYECSLYIGTEVFTKAEAISERQARFNAAKLAIDRIMEISNKVRNVSSSKEDSSVSEVVAGITSSLGRDSSISYPSNNGVTRDPIVDAYKNSSWLLNVINYGCSANPGISSFATHSSDLRSVSQNGSLRQNINSTNIFNEMNQNANRRPDSLSSLMIDYPHQNVSVRSCYPALSAELGYTMSNMLSSEKTTDFPNRSERFDLLNQTERFNVSCRTERFDSSSRTGQFDLSNRAERLDFPNRSEREGFDLPNRTERFDWSDMERFGLSNREERFNLPNREERFNLPNREERFNLPNRVDRFDLSNRIEREGFDLPNRTERFAQPNRERFGVSNITEIFNLQSRADPERFNLQSRVDPERFNLQSRADPERFNLQSRADPERFNLQSRADPERFDLPSRAERFDLPSRAERFDLPSRAERFNWSAKEFGLSHNTEPHNFPFSAERKHLPSQISGHQNQSKGDRPQIWLHEF